MLRLLVLSLIFANGVYFAWSSGALRAYGFAPQQQAEPQRLAQQLKPEAIRVLTPDEFRQVEAQRQAELAPKECLQVGPLTDAQWGALRPTLEEVLPTDAWQLDKVQQSARWIVYMGKYANVQALEKKRAELSAMNLKAQALSNPALEPGFSLGSFGTQEAANAELARLSVRGIRTAKVVQEQEEQQVNMLKLPAITEAMKQRLLEAKPALAGKSLKSCS
jgi:DNA-binding helix-hairpin-helix protein with protein kinase domain